MKNRLTHILITDWEMIYIDNRLLAEGSDFYWPSLLKDIATTCPDGFIFEHINAENSKLDKWVCEHGSCPTRLKEALKLAKQKV